MSTPEGSPAAEGRAAPTSERRGRPRPWLLVLALLLVCLLGAGVAWFVRDSSRPSSCDVVRNDARVEKALGDRYDEAMTCAELGAAVKAVTVGQAPGKHSLGQAQAMKDVLLAVAESIDKTDGGMDAGLRLPLGQVLADYRADLQENMGLTSAAYIRSGLPTKPAWEDGAGVHVSVDWKTALLPVVRAVSADPGAYAVIRDALTLQGAEGLVATEPDSTGSELSAPAARSAWALGNLDGVAADVVRDLGKDRGREWQAAVLAELSEAGDGGKTAVPAFSEDAAGHLVARWRADVNDKGAEALENQGASMFGAWCDAVRVTGDDREAARERVESGQKAARREALAYLD
ncbi:hypothetical protein OG298_16115 [Streptomyces sp. NBC_01005]|uniref:hypothetical protein n=1 Tax=unclassified Streptomyces TaxID=2593676 RepID=UPI003863B22E|nr:hypothetical protein OG298_16115 [Streptomyces sp. NBC_01005]WTC95284.1 hypothetical protein OH736_16120 [Streptomyces sp. NBC_01650]